jgi:flagellar biogenesis protein FliO
VIAHVSHHVHQVQETHQAAANSGSGRDALLLVFVIGVVLFGLWFLTTSRHAVGPENFDDD